MVMPPLYGSDHWRPFFYGHGAGTRRHAGRVLLQFGQVEERRHKGRVVGSVGGRFLYEGQGFVGYAQPGFALAGREQQQVGPENNLNGVGLLLHLGRRGGWDVGAESVEYEKTKREKKALAGTLRAVVNEAQDAPLAGQQA